MVKKKQTVSIVTITQFKRFQCLEILNDMIEAQTYDNIIEWVIVEGSLYEEDCFKNVENIQGLKKISKLNIIYLEKVKGEKLGALRNKGNKACSGDITVVMDDDDYYPPNRVEHAVEKLSESKLLIAGCSSMYIYDFTLDKLCKFKKFGPYHSVNNCLAWKKAYLEKYSHDPTKDCGEEPSFTNNFKEPMIQLDSEKTVIQSSHSSNTFNKRELITGGVTKINETLTEVNLPITNFISEPIFSRMAKIFTSETQSKYDIVYFAGGFSIQWDPSSKALTGSEQAIVKLSSEWVKLGKKVAVYGNIPEMSIDGVDYFDWKKFPFNEKHSLVILWRIYGILCAGPFPIKASEMWLDTHDGVNIKQFLEMWFRYGSKITKVMFKSEIAKNYFEKELRIKLTPERYAIIPNGVRIEEFSQNIENVSRNPYRFCYTSCYTRGLANILQHMWPIIYRAEPRAELHIYYGMDNVQDDKFKNAMTQLLAIPGVMDHGRQTVELIIREKYLSSFHLYISNSTTEIDCITIRESLLTGAIPLISNSGIFKERDGIHFDVVEEDPNTFSQAAVKLVHLMKDPNLDRFRENLKSSKSLITWANVAEQWLSQSSSFNMS